MKENVLTVIVNRPVEEVFNFATDPANTHKWVETIQEEKIDEWPIKLGTLYKNQNKSGIWSEYRVTKFESNKIFVLENLNGEYSVEYTFTPLDNERTKLIYRELVVNGELEQPFTQKELNRLK
jgi:uncharacterized protein YndB with AHSA1/START domain